MFIIVLLVCLKEDRQKTLADTIYYGLIIGGAASNLFDRIFYGAVVDYLDFRIWPVFNLSDSCITVAALFLIFSTLFNKDDKKSTN